MKFSTNILLALMFLCLSICSCGGQPETPTSEAVRKVLPNGVGLGEWKEADMYGGRALLSNKDFAFWVKDGVVYAANGFSINEDKGMMYTPHSIGYDEIKEAMDGKPFPMPRHFAQSVWELPKLIDKARNTDFFKGKFIAPVPTSGTNNIATISWEAPKIKGDIYSVAGIEVKEAGGMITEIFMRLEMSTLKDETKRNIRLQHAFDLCCTGIMFALPQLHEDKDIFKRVFFATLPIFKIDSKETEANFSIESAHFDIKRENSSKQGEPYVIFITITPSSPQ